MPLQLESVSSQQADITQRLRIVPCFVANILLFEKGEREKLVGVITLRRILFLLGNDHYKLLLVVVAVDSSCITYSGVSWPRT